MNKRVVGVVILAVTLLATNAWWLYGAIDFGITHTYAMDSCELTTQELAQLKAILPLVIRSGSTREEIVAAAQLEPWHAPFEKQGAVWVGQLGLRFTPDGHFVEVIDASN